MSKGIIKWFNNEKGYGFINSDVDEDESSSTVGSAATPI